MNECTGVVQQLWDGAISFVEILQRVQLPFEHSLLTQATQLCNKAAEVLNDVPACYAEYGAGLFMCKVNERCSLIRAERGRIIEDIKVLFCQKKTLNCGST